MVQTDPREALQNAASLVKQRQLDKAEQQARLALSDPQIRPAAYSVLGTIRFEQKRLAESAKFFQEAVRLEPRLLGANLILAEVYTFQGKTDLALGQFRHILTLDPLNIPARIALARSETEKGHYRQSLDLARPVLPALKQSPDGLLVLTADYLETGDRLAAADLVKDWLRLPDVPLDWSIKFALLLAKEGEVDEAIEILEDAGQPNLYLLKKDFSLALKYYDLAVAQNPEAVPALRQAAATAEQHGELERSLSYWIRAKKIEPEDPEILLGFGRVCLKMDLLEDAEPALTKAASLRPENPAYQYTLASVKVGTRQFEAAEELLGNLIKMKPLDSQFQYALGSVLYLQGKLADAGTHLRESIRLQPNQLGSPYYLALVVRDRGNEAEAIQRLEELLQHYPDDAASCEALGCLLVGAHRYLEAKRNLERAIRLNPKSVKANYQLGLLLMRMGKKEEANKRLELAKSLRTEDESSSRLQLRLLDPVR